MNSGSNDNDKDLHTYLEGQDGISDTYQKLGQPEPPAHLDALILAQAHASLDADSKPTPASGYFSGKYSIAASLVTGILIGSMIFGSDLLRPTSTSEQIVINPASRSIVVMEQERATASDTFMSGDTGAIPPAAEPALKTTESDERSQTENINELLTVVAEARLADNNSERQEAQREQSFRESSDNQAEEIVVTGSRVRTASSPALVGNSVPAQDRRLAMDDLDVNASSADPDLVPGAEFRLNPETWAEEIYYLTLESNDLEVMLDEEARLFRQRFPDADLDALVDQVEQQLNQ